MKPNRVHSFILAAVIVFAGLLYFYRLGQESLCTQEYYTMYAAQKTPAQILVHDGKSLNPNAPPLYYLLLHFWLKVFGLSEFSQRFPSALFGLMSIYLLYRLGRLLFDRQTGILSAGFAAFSFAWLAIFRQNRCYSLFVLLTLLSFLVFYSFLKNKGSRKWLWRLILVNILLVYTHYLGFLVIALEGFFTVWEWEKYRRGVLNFVWMSVAVAAAYLPWLKSFLFDLRFSPLIPGDAPYFTPAGMAFDFFRVIFYDFHFAFNPILTLIYVPFLVRGIARIKERTVSSNPGGYLIATFAVPTVVFFFVMNIDRIRYFTPFMFPLLLILACGFRGLSLGTIVRKVGFVSMVAIIAMNNLLDIREYLHTSFDEQWKEAAEKIKNAPSPGKDKAIVFQTAFNVPPFVYYYWGPDAARAFVPGHSAKTDYAGILSSLGAKEKIAVVGVYSGEAFLSRLAPFAPGSPVWVFRYHDPRFFPSVMKDNRGRFIIKRIRLSRALSRLDLFFFKRIPPAVAAPAESSHQEQSKP